MFSPRHLVRRLLRRPLITSKHRLGIALAVALGVAGPLASNALAALGSPCDGASPACDLQNIQLTRTGKDSLQPIVSACSKT